MSWWEWVLVAAAGAIGAPLRYVIDTLVSERAGTELPYGTFLINVSGSFVLGVVTGLALYHGFTGAPKLVIGTGLLGAYTTFSTFSFETVALAESGAGRQAFVNALGSCLAGTLAAAAGWALAAL